MSPEGVGRYALPDDKEGVCSCGWVRVRWDRPQRLYRCSNMLCAEFGLVKFPKPLPQAKAHCVEHRRPFEECDECRALYQRALWLANYGPASLRGKPDGELVGVYPGKASEWESR